MSKLILTALKTVIISVGIIIFADLSIFLYDVYNVHNKVNNLLDIIEKDVSEHNGIPSTMVTVYNEMLDDIQAKSYVMTGYETNFTGALDEIESLSYEDGYIVGESIASADSVAVYEYGEIIDIGINITFGYSLSIETFDTDTQNANFDEFTDQGTSLVGSRDDATRTWNSELELRRTVPGLRYLK